MMSCELCGNKRAEHNLFPVMMKAKGFERHMNVCNECIAMLERINDEDYNTDSTENEKEPQSNNKG